MSPRFCSLSSILAIIVADGQILDPRAVPHSERAALLVLAALSAATCRLYSATLCDQPRSFDRPAVPRTRRPKVGSDLRSSNFFHRIALTLENVPERRGDSHLRPAGTATSKTNGLRGRDRRPFLRSPIAGYALLAAAAEYRDATRIGVEMVRHCRDAAAQRRMCVPGHRLRGRPSPVLLGPLPVPVTWQGSSELALSGVQICRRLAASRLAPRKIIATRLPMPGPCPWAPFLRSPEEHS